MADPREQILQRLVAVLGDVEGIRKVKRNELDQNESTLPLAVILDGDETAADNDPVSRPPTAPRIMTMTPEIYVVVANKAVQVGTDVNLFRSRVINAIAADAEIVALTKDREGGRYEGAASGLSRGRSMMGEVGLSFSFRYVLRPGSI
ncbi:hypothetical protein RLPCCGM1_c1264 [Rhizobium leguminosarum bv. phaseoli CCGM1]|uniref:hypothetical protein n=1 Tax=Rhizobium phaseoli TaxID=396 RepID=UPI0004D4EA1D|nr:hypothetical protein [Rhizobium phaseoli]KEC73148.1 hypothetical protein RLPCCGM1_c1264 [Rhizobium leguminosarum bv. phaseoli CCGM1]PWI54119.1 hypothetical protein B5K03_11800 [Rhizobium phaseoli]